MPSKNKKPAMGENWLSHHSDLYRLYRRVAEVARVLEERRRNGRVPAKKYIEELDDIANQLKALDLGHAKAGYATKLLPNLERLRGIVPARDQ